MVHVDPLKVSIAAIFVGIAVAWFNGVIRGWEKPVGTLSFAVCIGAAVVAIGGMLADYFFR